MMTCCFRPVALVVVLSLFAANSAWAQQDLTLDDLKPTREKKADEKCSDAVVGQFYFKICKTVMVPIETTEDYWEDERCVVYDKVRCCNVIVTVPVKKTRKITKEEPREKEFVFCKQFKVSLSQLITLPDCPCDDKEFLSLLQKQGSLTLMEVLDASQLAEASTRPEQIAPRSKPGGMVAVPAQPSTDRQTGRALLAKPQPASLRLPR